MTKNALARSWGLRASGDGKRYSRYPDGTGPYSPPNPAAGDFSTSFDGDENPMSQGGIWQQGLANGLLWNNVKTIGGNAVGVADMSASRYADDIAHVKTATRAFAANQYAMGTAYVASGYTGNGGSHEIELLLRWSITANDAHGYEVLWGVGPSGGYVACVRWNGGLGDYTVLLDPTHDGRYPAPVDGDTFYAQIVGQTVKVKINGVDVAGFEALNVGSTYASGQPGIGYWPADGGIPDQMGWKLFSAGDL